MDALAIILASEGSLTPTALINKTQRELTHPFPQVAHPNDFRLNIGMS